MRTLYSLLIMLLVACNTAENTAEEFVEALIQEEYETAKNLSNERTQALIAILEGAQQLKTMNKDADQIYEEAIRKSANKDVEFDCTCEQVEDIAKCNC